MNKIHLCTLAVLTSLSFSSLAKDCDANLLPSWKDSDSKTAIVNFVEQSTDSSKATFIPVSDRIAVVRQRRYTLVRKADLFPNCVRVRSSQSPCENASRMENAGTF